MLRANPNVWHVIEDAPKTSTTDIRRGSPRAFLPAGSFDAVHSGGELFIKYVGEGGLGVDWMGQRADGQAPCSTVPRGYRCVRPDGHKGKHKSTED